MKRTDEGEDRDQNRPFAQLASWKVALILVCALVGLVAGGVVAISSGETNPKRLILLGTATLVSTLAVTAIIQLAQRGALSIRAAMLWGLALFAVFIFATRFLGRL